MDIDKVTQEERDFVLEQTKDVIDLLFKVLRKNHPEITEKDIEKLVNEYLE
jgi:hypothetical protein